ncbi:MAG: ABC transporter ATP-binding protein [Microvirga sp.]
MSAPRHQLTPEEADATSGALLRIEDLKTVFHTEVGTVHAVDGVSFDVRPGEVLAVVGESGCGKSVTALSIMGLIPAPAGEIVSGSINFRGSNLLHLHPEERRAIRGDRIAMVFQDPLTALNPVHRVGAQIAELIQTHRDVNRKDAGKRAVELLKLVGIPGAEERARQYPHHFSGGMRQRVMIAMALSCDPQLLIADEPTTALDVTIQAQILDLLNDLKARLGMAIMLITHAMGVVAETAQRVVVMYAGKVVEEATVERLFAEPLHPYTQGLIRSIPRIDRAATHKTRLETIAGVVPRLLDPPPGCRFSARCRFASAACVSATPPLVEVTPGHKVACVLHEASRGLAA